MTIEEFLDKVDWEKFYYTGFIIRENSTNDCPLQYVFGHTRGYTDRASKNLSILLVEDIIDAADGAISYSLAARELRNEMIKRMKAAQEVK